MKYVLDSHVVKWLMAERRKLSRRVLRSLEDPEAEAIISTISLGELFHMREHGKMLSSVPEVVKQLSSAMNVSFIPFDLDTALRLPSGLEFHDAAIVATALWLAERSGQRVAIITSDVEITKSGLVPVLW